MRWWRLRCGWTCQKKLAEKASNWQKLFCQTIYNLTKPLNWQWLTIFKLVSPVMKTVECIWKLYNKLVSGLWAKIFFEVSRTNFISNKNCWYKMEHDCATAWSISLQRREEEKFEHVSTNSCHACSQKIKVTHNMQVSAVKWIEINGCLESRNNTFKKQ